MPMPKPKLSVRVLVIAALVVCAAAGLVLLVRFWLHRLAAKRRNRG
jgi:hypothetical protein